MLQDGGAGGNDPGDSPNGGDGGGDGNNRLPPKVVKQKKRGSKTVAPGDKARVQEESDSDMSDRDFQLVEKLVDGRTSSKGLGLRPRASEAEPQLHRDVTGRVVEPESDKDGEEDELAERFQKLGIKKLHKLHQRQVEADRRKHEEKKKDVRCFHSTQAGERWKRDRL